METQYSVTVWIVTHVIAIIAGVAIGIVISWLKHR